MPNFPELTLGAWGIGVSPGSAIQKRPRVRKAPFGNGYTQRSGDGLNANLRTFAVKFTNLTQVEADKIDSFLDGRKGYLPFTCKLPRTGQLGQWTCEEWTRSYDDKGVDSLSATFVENVDA